MPLAPLSSVQLYYELHGTESDQPLLLLHGATETFQTGWRKQIHPFSHHFRLIGVDLRGHGQSNNPAGRLDLRQMADDMAELLTYLGVNSAHICGFSGGGSVALFLALRHPGRLRSLVHISGNFEQDQRRTGAVDFWNVARIQQEEPRWWQAMNKLHPNVPQLLSWWAEEDPQRPNFTPAELAHITLPTLIVGGDDDHIIPLEQTVRLYQALPQAHLFIMPNMGHGLPQRHPQRFNQIVLQFLQMVCATAQGDNPT